MEGGGDLFPDPCPLLPPKESDAPCLTRTPKVGLKPVLSEAEGPVPSVVASRK